MKRSAVMVAIAIAVLGALLLQPFQLGDGRLLWITGKPVSSAVLETAGLPEQATEIGNVFFNDLEGTLPEMSRVSFTTLLTESALREFYAERCAATGLTKPSVEDIASQPSILCKGRVKGAPVSLHLSTTCDESACKAELVASVL